MWNTVILLPDQDLVVANHYKLIVVVYVGIAMKENCMGNSVAVAYSGPTYIGISSSKQSLCHTSNHAVDFKK